MEQAEDRAEGKQMDEGEEQRTGVSSRRDFLRSTAVKGAVTALFGAMTFDAVMARAMSRVADVQAADRIGGEAGRRLRSVRPQGSGNACPIANYTCTANVNDTCSGTVSCGRDGYDCGNDGHGFGCTGRDFNCQNLFTCETYYNCTPTLFQCPPQPGAFQCNPTAIYNGNYP